MTNDVQASKSIKRLVGRKQTKIAKFGDSDVEIRKLSVAEVMEIQKLGRSAEGSDTGGLDVIKAVIKMSAEGGADLTEEDFQSFSMDDLTSLSTEIMEFSGISTKGSEGN